jgi:hypothetical protein
MSLIKDADTTGYRYSEHVSVKGPNRHSWHKNQGEAEGSLPERKPISVGANDSHPTSASS